MKLNPKLNKPATYHSNKALCHPNTMTPMLIRMQVPKLKNKMHSEHIK